MMRIHINQIFVKHAYRSSSVRAEVRSLALHKKLLSVPGAILSKLSGMPMEGLCGPGTYYGMAVAQMVSRKDAEIDLEEGTKTPGRPAVDPLAKLAS